MKTAIVFITITLLVSLGFLVVNAQDLTLGPVNGTLPSAARAGNKSTVKKQSSKDDDSWTGFYAGGYFGFAQSRSNPKLGTENITSLNGFSDVTLTRINSAGNQKAKSNGSAGGGTFGFNYQTGKFFAGAELDFGGRKTSQEVESFTTTVSDSPLRIRQAVSSNWLMTARPRAGVATNKVLAYGTAGLAVTNIRYAGDFETHTSSPYLNETGVFSKLRRGWTVGAGLELKVARRWSIKGEYLFSEFGATSIGSSDAAIRNRSDSSILIPLPNQPFFHSTDLKSHNVRFGVNYRF